MVSLRIIVACLSVIIGLVLFSIPAFPLSLRLFTEHSEVPALVQALKNGDKEARQHAAYRLGQIWPKENVGEAVSALINALRDPAFRVRWQAASSLGYLKAPEAVDALINSTADERPEVAGSAAQSLGKIGPPASRAAPYLKNLLKSENYKIRKIAAIALARIGIGVEQAVPVMINDLDLPDEWARYEAAYALGFMGQAAQPAVPALRRLLKDPSGIVRQEACRTLHSIGTPEAKEGLNDYPEDCSERMIIPGKE
jgi:HEAT repeat protein